MKTALIITGCIILFELAAGVIVFLVGAFLSITPEPVDLGDPAANLPQWCDRCRENFALDGCDLCEPCITEMVGRSLRVMDDERGCND